MTDFKSDPLAFRRQTARRMVLEVLLLILLLAAVLIDVVPTIPKWVQWSAVIAFGTYIIAGIVFYPQSKAIANSFCVKLHDDGLIFSHARGGGEVKYSDLRVAKVKRRHDEPTEIVLVAKSGQVVRLRGLENMTELYRLLSVRVAS